MNDRLQFLFNKYLAEKITAGEKSELSGLISSANDKEILDLLSQEWENNEEEISVLSSDEADSILKQIIGENSAKVIPIYFYQKTWFRVAAAVLFMVGVFSIYKMVGTEKKTEQQVAHVEKINEDIAPGGNKATLTLSDGSTIILDTAENGTLTHQGNARVVKLKNGKIAYQQRDNVSKTKVEYNTVTTPRGGQYQLELADGSKVWLNAASSITFPTLFTGNRREVNITGEAYFEVAHNTKMPFHVGTNGIEVQVLGTHFNINAYGDDGVINTTLLEGSVKVTKGNGSVIINPGEQAQVNKSTGNITTKKDVDLESAIAWKNGKFIFQGEEIQGIMKQLDRWYDVSISYQTKITRERFVGVISRNVNLSQILSMLEKTGVVKFKIVGKNVIVEE